MYDELDYICPVLYQRFGPDDGTAEQVQGWSDTATRQAIDSSLTLTRSDGAVIPLCPVLTFWVANGKSENASRRSRPSPCCGNFGRCAGIARVRWRLSSYGPEAEDMEGATKPRETVDFRDFLVASASCRHPIASRAKTASILLAGGFLTAHRAARGRLRLRLPPDRCGGTSRQPRR